MTGAGVVAQYQTQLIIHRSLNFNQQRSQRELYTLHYRHIVLNGQIRIAGNVTAALNDLLSLTQCFANQRNLESITRTLEKDLRATRDSLLHCRLAAADRRA